MENNFIVTITTDLKQVSKNESKLLINWKYISKFIKTMRENKSTDI